MQYLCTINFNSSLCFAVLRNENNSRNEQNSSRALSISLTSHQRLQTNRLVAAVCRYELLLTITTMDHQLANLLVV